MRRVETRFEMLGEYWDWSVREPGFPFGGNKLMDTRYLRPTEGPFYHGTAQKIAIGSVIEPTRHNPNAQYLYPSNAWDSWSEPRDMPLDENLQPARDFDTYAFAAKNIDVARRYARQKQARSGKRVGDKWVYSAGYIYEVEPLKFDYHYDPEDSYFPQDRGDRGGAESFRSPSGWRVIKLVETIPPVEEEL